MKAIVGIALAGGFVFWEPGESELRGNGIVSHLGLGSVGVGTVAGVTASGLTRGWSLTDTREFGLSAGNKIEYSVNHRPPR
jgi:hypothetical protein